MAGLLNISTGDEILRRTTLYLQEPYGPRDQEMRMLINNEKDEEDDEDNEDEDEDADEDDDDDVDAADDGDDDEDD